MIWQLSFGCMGTRVHMLLDGDPELLPGAARRVQHLDRIWSRFREDSEVSLANRRAGTAVAASAETLELFELSGRAREMTGGLFDPTLLEEIVAAGYDRDFEQLREGSAGPARQLPPRSLPSEQVLAVDRGAGTVTVAAGHGFDSGGIGKGLGAEIVAAELVAAGAGAALVNLGGDLFAAGEAPEEGWSVALDNPFAPPGSAAAMTLAMRDGALATSTTHSRHWLQAGRLRHHIIDPRTGEPAESNVAAATVVCDSGWRAEALAKAVLLSGAERGLELLGEGASGLLVTEAGEVRCTPELEPSLRPRPAALANLRRPKSVRITLPGQ